MSSLGGWGGKPILGPCLLLSYSAAVPTCNRLALPSTCFFFFLTCASFSSYMSYIPIQTAILQTLGVVYHPCTTLQQLLI